MSPGRAIALAALLALVAPAAHAQNVMSSTEIQDRLNKQSRGLKLVRPPDTSEPAASDQQQKAVAAERVPTNAPAQTVATAPRELTPGEEVNLTVEFAFDSAVLLPAARAQLNELCDALRAVEIDRFNIYGHTDATGSVEYNLTLSKARANEVKRYLTRECGLPEGRIEAVGMGESRLFDPSRPSAGENRRVEVQAAT